jgi:hypothetical protein
MLLGTDKHLPGYAKLYPKHRGPIELDDTAFNAPGLLT